ncbi:MFS family permease [Fontibacillus solani]|uniref:MFS family permease n=1 Tax=Fontibacillus solani TaxID=1572857 RepID=A0A7W3XTC0_9BACL|nr:YwiC-like family protein [Fontibacillus solani]MBA9087424.1 MFS family permease [Fontibacillus solani]
MKYYIPNQHGAWAMLIIPFLFGIIASKPNLVHILLFACWLIIYLLMFAVLQWIRTKKTIFYRKPVLIYTLVLIPFALWLVVLRPVMVVLALVFLPLFIVNAYYAKQKRERALVNDIAAIVQFSLMVFISFLIGEGTDYGLAAKLFIVSLLYFVGTALYVKTMIREKNNKRFYYYSISYHIALVLLSLWFLPWVIIAAAAVLLIRAIGFPRIGITVKQAGISEIVCSIVVLVSVWIA